MAQGFVCSRSNKARKRIRMIVIDSSFIVSVFVENEENHKRAKEIFQKLISKEEDIYVPTLLAPEVTGTIRRVMNDVHFAQIIEETLKSWMDNIFIPKDLTEDSMNSAVDSTIRFGLKGGDAVFVSLAKDLNAQLLTFDEEVKKKIKNKIKLYSL